MSRQQILSNKSIGIEFHFGTAGEKKVLSSELRSGDFLRAWKYGIEAQKREAGTKLFIQEMKWEAAENISSELSEWLKFSPDFLGGFFCVNFSSKAN